MRRPGNRGNPSRADKAAKRDESVGSFTEWQSKNDPRPVQPAKVELVVVPDDMGEYRFDHTSGRLWILQAQLNRFFNEQKKQETNGQTVARLMREGRWHEFI